MFVIRAQFGNEVVARPAVPSETTQLVEPTGRQKKIKSERSFVNICHASHAHSQLFFVSRRKLTHLSSFLLFLTSTLQVRCPVSALYLLLPLSLFSFRPLLVMRMWDGYESMSGLQQRGGLGFSRLPGSVWFITGGSEEDTGGGTGLTGGDDRWLTRDGR